jgi:hypothetical protein
MRARMERAVRISRIDVPAPFATQNSHRAYERKKPRENTKGRKNDYFMIPMVAILFLTLIEEGKDTRPQENVGRRSTSRILRSKNHCQQAPVTAQITVQVTV